MTIKQITDFLETVAPRSYQEDYDNAGLLTGRFDMEVTEAIVSLDVTEAVLDEAIESGANLVIAHHPAIFRGLKKLTGSSYTERIIIKAIKNDIALYAIHTNLDNVAQGVNGKMAALLGLKNTRVLLPKDDLLKKLICFAPEGDVEKLKEAIFQAGAGRVGNYSECSYISEGTGSFKPEKGANPTVGEVGKRETGKEIKLEFLFPAFLEAAVVTAMKEAHSYEEIAYDVLALGNEVSSIGSGLIGELPAAVSGDDLLRSLNSVFGTPAIKHTAVSGRKIRTVAVCGGAGSFLIKSAFAAGADAFVTSDLKYHEYFDAESRLLIDIGHYESEQYTSDLIIDLIRREFPTFALRKTGVNTNPVQYFIPGK